MQTFIAYRDPPGQDSPPPDAYCQTDAGEVWGPLRPLRPDPAVVRLFPSARSSDVKGQDIETWLRGSHAGCVVAQPDLHAGQYYPRIWRTGERIEYWGEAIPRVEETQYLASFVNSLEQIEGLSESLAAIFRVVHPAADGNLKAYGGAIRDVIILACTEAEAQWKNVLKANGVASIGKNYNTNDYVKLLPVMKLGDYTAALVRYPGLPPVAPFSAWDTANPTKSLTWYDAYNSVKHDRESAFHEATLGHAIDAVTACVVMLTAQFGVQALRRHRLNSLFEFKKRPTWGPKEYYYQPVPGQPWIEVGCPL